MANGNNKILTAEEKLQLRQPIDDYVGKIQKQIDSLSSLTRISSMESRETVRFPKKKKRHVLKRIKQN